MATQLSWETEFSFRTEGAAIVCGCDEAGRGPLAGPVFAAAVVLPDGMVIEGLNDSKKLSEKKREELYEEIRAKCVDCAVAHAEVYEIEAINILNASMLAMRRAIALLRVKPELALITRLTARIIASNHYRKLPLSPDLSRLFFDAYLKGAKAAPELKTSDVMTLSVYEPDM